MQDAKPIQPPTVEDSSEVAKDKPAAKPAAVDTFLKIDGLKGESTDAEHKDWIE